MSKIATLGVVKASKLSRVKVKTPEWAKDSYIFVRMLPGDEQESVSALFDNKTMSANERRCRLLCLFACDDTGNPLFDDTAVPILLKRAMGPIQRAVAAGMELNGFGPVAEEAIEGN